MKHFIDINNFKKTEIDEIIALAKKIKKNPKKYSSSCKNKTLGLIFEKQSLRTRLSFNVGMQKLGGSVLELQGKDIGFDDKREKAESTLDKFSKSSEVNEFKLNSSIIDNGIMIRTCDDVFPGAATYHREFNSQYTFTPEECQKILQQSEKLYPEKSKIGADSGVYDPKVRSVDTYHIELTDETRWIFNKICTAVGKVNSEYYKFDLLGITHSLQLLHYKATENGHYDWHIDSGPGSSSTRKISLSIPLTERDAYEGGNLEINDQGEEIKAIDEQGSITFFPSYALHRVSPVTKGERWVIVAWVHGPNRFR